MVTGVLSLAAALAVVPGAPGVITEEAFLNATLGGDHVRAVLDEPLVLARAERARAGAWPDPVVSFEREALDGAPRQDTWSLSWAPPLDGRTWVHDRAARAGHAAAQNRRALSEVVLRSDLREAFAEWALARDGAMLGRRLADIADGLAVRAAAQAESGEASPLDARRLTLARIEIHAEAAALEARFARATGTVRGWMPALAAETAPERPGLPPVPADTALWSTSPGVAALDADIRQAEAAAALAGRFWPLPELTIGRQTLRGGIEDGEGPVYGVRWGLPLFSRGSGDRIEARGRLDAARARHALERAHTREGFHAALAAYEPLRRAAALAAAAEPAAAQVLEGATARFDAGESDVTDLLETLRGVLGGGLAALDAYGAALRAHRDLEVAAGRALPLSGGGE